MADYDFEESIGYWLTVCTQSYHRALSELMAPSGITHRQTHVIGWLKACGDLSQGELARRMLIEPPTLVRILDRMEESGWIRRDGDPGDRRRRIVRLTPEAEPLWEQITECARELRRLAVVGLTEQEAVTLKQLLRRVSANLSTSPRLPEVV